MLSVKKINKFWIGLLIGIILTASLKVNSIAFADNQQQIKIVVNGQQVTCDVPPQIVNGRTMVPISAVAQALGCQVQWDGANNSVIITSNNSASNQISTIDNKVNSTNANIASTNLLLAINNGDINNVKTLINNGEDPNSTDTFGNSLLSLVITSENNRQDPKKTYELLQILLNAGANPNSTYNNNIPLIHSGDSDIIKLLLIKGANPDSIDNNGATSLMLNARYGNIEACKILLNAGANINKQDNDENTPLIYLVILDTGIDTQARTNMVKFLLANNADKTITNKKGQTVLSLASSLGYTEMADLLK